MTRQVGWILEEEARASTGSQASKLDSLGSRDLGGTGSQAACEHSINLKCKFPPGSNAEPQGRPHHQLSSDRYRLQFMLETASRNRSRYAKIIMSSYVWLLLTSV